MHKIRVLGMDPSLRNWGMAEATYDLRTGEIEVLNLHLIQPKEETSKQVRKNSKDIEIATQLSAGIQPLLANANFIFAEVPIGSQSARAMASYGICIGILGVINHSSRTLIEVSPTEVKVAFTGTKTATKEQMIAKAMQLYPSANFPRHQGRVTNKAEHVADAIASIHAGVQTPYFKLLKQLHLGTKQ